MSKIIKVTEELLAEIQRDFAEALKKVRMADGEISYKKSFGTIDAKATLYFTEKAWVKMQFLVMKTDKEIAWHGTAERLDGEENAYLINDILIYPQSVTGATVNTDQDRYREWWEEFDDDMINSIKMQGHSHVNMGVTPSGTDLTNNEAILAQLRQNSFYIFLIWNKRDEQTIKIYDMQKNILFETKDVEVMVVDGECKIMEFMQEVDELVTTKSYQYQTPSKQVPAATTPASTTAKPEEKEKKEEKTGVKKGKKKKKESSSAKNYGYPSEDKDDYYPGYSGRYGAYRGYYDDYWEGREW